MLGAVLDTKSHQSNRAERLLSDINSSCFTKSVQKVDFTTNNRFHWKGKYTTNTKYTTVSKCAKYTKNAKKYKTNTKLDIARITQLQPFSQN